MNSFDVRFSGVRRLFGRAGVERLRAAHVAVVGLGGVGSWAVEALARSGVGELTLVDLDDICVSNVNRQLHALDGAFGQPKVEVLGARVEAINPECKVHRVCALLTYSNVDEILAPAFDFLLDAIDSPSKKSLLIARGRERRIPIMTIGASAGRRDPLAVQVRDLAFAHGDRLLQQVRKQLRVRYDFPRGESEFGVPGVFSTESPVFPAEDGEVNSRREGSSDLRLDCDAGFGTASFVTGAFGLIAASRIVQALALGSRPVDSNSFA